MSPSPCLPTCMRPVYIWHHVVRGARLRVEWRRRVIQPQSAGRAGMPVSPWTPARRADLGGDARRHDRSQKSQISANDVWSRSRPPSMNACRWAGGDPLPQACLLRTYASRTPCSDPPVLHACSTTSIDHYCRREKTAAVEQRVPPESGRANPQRRSIITIVATFIRSSPCGGEHLEPNV